MVYAILILAILLVLDATGVLELNLVFKAVLKAAVIISILYVVGIASFYWLLQSIKSIDQDARAENSSKVTQSSNSQTRSNSHMNENTFTPEIEQLISKWYESNAKCRGGAGDDKSTLEQCELRDNQDEKLQSLGICYGEKEQFGYEMKWHKCNSNSLIVDNKVKNEPVTNFDDAESMASEGLMPQVSQDEFKPSFDCSKARSKAEHLICNDSELSKLDTELAKVYREAKSKALNADEFKKQTNAAWKWRELNCKDKQCLLDWYAERNSALMKLIETEIPQSTSSNNYI